MTVEASALVPGATFCVTKELRAYCCTGSIPAGAVVEVWPEQPKGTTPNRILVRGTPGGIHRVRKSSLRMAAAPIDVVEGKQGGEPGE